MHAANTTRGSSRNTPAAGGAALERQNPRDRVNACLASGQFAEALSRCRTLLEMYPGDIDARLLMARALESAVRVAEAREVIEPLLRDVQGKNESVELQVQQLIAAVLVHEKRQGEAVELLDRAIA